MTYGIIYISPGRGRLYSTKVLSAVCDPSGWNVTSSCGYNEATFPAMSLFDECLLLALYWFSVICVNGIYAYYYKNVRNLI